MSEVQNDTKEVKKVRSKKKTAKVAVDDTKDVSLVENMFSEKDTSLVEKDTSLAVVEKKKPKTKRAKKEPAARHPEELRFARVRDESNIRMLMRLERLLEMLAGLEKIKDAYPRLYLFIKNRVDEEKLLEMVDFLFNQSLDDGSTFSMYFW
jgi:hypothetical protein